MRILFIKWAFKHLFKGYQFPFEKLNDKLIRMNDAHRKNYYQQARELLEMEVYKDIMQEAIRKFYQKLSVSSNSSIEQAAYRLTLIWINEEFEQVFKKMSLSFSNNPPKLNPKM